MHIDPSKLELMDQIFEGLYILGLDGKILFWNRAAELITGYRREETVGKSCSDGILMHCDTLGTELCGSLCPMKATMGDFAPREAEVFLHHKLGHRIPVTVRATPMRDDHGNVIGAIELFFDNSKNCIIRDRVAELERLSLLDELTGLPNRRFLNQQVESRLAESARIGLSMGVLMIDIDLFKDVNDTFGHAAGDEALRNLARTLEAVKRPYDVAGRWGGEEFLVVAVNTDLSTLHALGERFRAQTERALVHYGSHVFTLTISLGGACALPDDTPDSIIRRADENLYRSKAQGRNRITVL